MDQEETLLQPDGLLSANVRKEPTHKPCANSALWDSCELWTLLMYLPPGMHGLSFCDSGLNVAGYLCYCNRICLAFTRPR
jgi:hypothetical protein